MVLAIDFNLCRAQNPLLDQRDSTSVEGELASAHATHLATLGWIPLRSTGTGTGIISKIMYFTVPFHKGTLNDTYHCEVIIVQDPKHDYSQQNLLGNNAIKYH